MVFNITITLLLLYKKAHLKNLKNTIDNLLIYLLLFETYIYVLLNEKVFKV